eukprot:TRINITY_DN374_c0_g1_i2.p1 TRINITY_DN374_c0_g1~~TRINITY_DN374_c0_g1_i2.p1  ORF type:complete len:134 (+),score=18.43 TRINITY_DN374_c0_g1_i2:590-991(+)
MWVGRLEEGGFGLSGSSSCISWGSGGDIGVREPDFLIPVIGIRLFKNLLVVDLSGVVDREDVLVIGGDLLLAQGGEDKHYVDDHDDHCLDDSEHQQKDQLNIAEAASGKGEGGKDDVGTVSYTHLTLPTKRIV